MKKKEHVETGANIAMRKCTGNLCSKNGVEFATCLTTCVPAKNMSLALVARECVFATKELTSTPPNDKCFLRYYHCATTACQFRGKGNRIELPECVKWAVIELCPNGNKLNQLPNAQTQI